MISVQKITTINLEEKLVKALEGRRNYNFNVYRLSFYDQNVMVNKLEYSKYITIYFESKLPLRLKIWKLECLIIVQLLW